MDFSLYGYQSLTKWKLFMIVDCWVYFIVPLCHKKKKRQHSLFWLLCPWQISVLALFSEPYGIYSSSSFTGSKQCVENGMNNPHCITFWVSCPWQKIIEPNQVDELFKVSTVPFGADRPGKFDKLALIHKAMFLRCLRLSHGSLVLKCIGFLQTVSRVQ